ncbi:MULTISPECIES: ACP S-malonyltransferase [Streptomyces]|uniref:ACP S-malonyltransferase n=1 Tax=Streptomyces TaxID=1883 RepID=UPI00163CB91D|nr:MULTISPECIES: ACP S-malonyltransferase [Streptomyces]MBC2879746.1 ACP S-malonyltransferase [Streptomyces sp. TYQ1024]UBI35059.1 ACP S-malonyltransferase [Streptomyces mobaraensis]UKW27654.1 ACP S-malonyltransferase [Streptomyces sp. TYQ1024]
MTTASRTGTAMIFPGMGPTPFAEVGKFMVVNPFARKLVAAADRVLGYSLVDRYRTTEGDYSEYAQVAFMVNSLALAQWAGHTLGVEAGLCTGPSFGEKPAAAFSGALDFPDAVRATAAFARLLEDYFATEYTDLVTHSFVRVPQDTLRELLGELDERGEMYEISCYIDDDFTMLTLREHNLEWLPARLRALGGMSLYTMRPPMHCSLFKGLRDRAEEEVFGPLEFADPTVPVIADQDGALVTTGEGVRAMMLDSCVRPLRWPAVVDALREAGVGTVCVAGQDSLFGRVRRTTDAFEVVPATPRLALRPRPRPASA